MKNKILSLILALAAVLMMLVSCEGIFGTTPPTGGGGENPPEEPTGLKLNSIVYAADGIDFAGMRLEMMEILGDGVTVNPIANKEESDGEVVFGDSDRAVTVAAKATLEAAIASDRKNDTGYIIYCDGKSVAVYWKHPDMKNIAVSDFLEICVRDMELELEEGTVHRELFVQRDFEVEKYWLNLESTASPDVVSALKTLNAFYDSENIIDWMANLYDPEIGAFYYSISARDNEPFRPDIESTHQILSLLVSSGALEDKNQLPSDIKAKILSFTLNTQSPKDGYFYHPQWPQDREKLNTDRYGRDLSRAVILIADLDIDLDDDGIEDDIYPFWCTPNGKKCEKHKDGGTCVFPIDTVNYMTSSMSGSVTGALGSGVSAAVSTLGDSYVKAVAVSSHPDYSSRTAFKNWLYEYNASIKENSGKAHNLSAIASEIKAHGYTDIVVEQIMTAQREVYEEQMQQGIEPTGLWQRTADFNAVWGILKYASYYNNKEYWTTPMPMEYILCMVKTCIKVIAMPIDGAYEANDVFNMWLAIDRILTHIDTHYGKDEKQQVYALMRENAAELIRNSLDKVEPFKRTDGSFSYRSSGNSLATIYGSNISLGTVEGDVNAVALCCQMYEGIFTALGYEQVPLFTGADGERFIEIIKNCQPIEKNEGDVEILDFESTELPYGTSVKIGSTGGKGEIQSDPTNAANNAFLFSANAGSSSNVTINTHQLGASCYTFDTDMYVSSDAPVTGYVFQMFLADAYIITVSINNDGTVTIGDDRNGSKVEKEFGKVSMDTWFRLTVQLYVPSEDNGIDSPKIKVWIDEKYCGESDNFYDKNGNGVFVEGYTFVKLWSMKRGDTDIYFDNCYFAAENIYYEESNETFEDVRLK